MTETELPAKAPEAEPQEAATGTPTQAAPGASEHCVTDRPTPSGQAATGEIIKINDVETYVSKPGDYPHAPGRLLLLLTGGTGLRSTNNQLQADKFASEGFLVVMPDLFGGDAAPNSAALNTSGEETEGSILGQVKLRAVETAKSFLIDMWLARHTAEKVLPILYRVIDGCIETYADSVKEGDGIYAVGYCIGGRYVLVLAGEKLPSIPAGEEPRPGPLIKAGALAHGASVTPTDFNSLRVPVSLVCVENDPLFPDEVRTVGEDVMARANLEHEVKVYPGVPHGFAVVGEYPDVSIKQAQETAYEQMLHWIKQH